MFEASIGTAPQMELFYREREATDLAWPTAISVCAMTFNDIPEVIELLKDFPTVCFYEWEDETLLAQVLAQCPTMSFVACDGDRVVGALIGGAFATRGSINHLVVDTQYRRQGIGQALVTHALASFQQAGIHRAFLFVLLDSPEAVAFWQGMGFRPTVGELTLEQTLSPAM